MDFMSATVCTARKSAFKGTCTDVLDDSQVATHPTVDYNINDVMITPWRTRKMNHKAFIWCKTFRKSWVKIKSDIMQGITILILSTTSLLVQHESAQLEWQYHEFWDLWPLPGSMWYHSQIHLNQKQLNKLDQKATKMLRSFILGNKLNSNQYNLFLNKKPRYLTSFVSPV